MRRFVTFRPRQDVVPPDRGVGEHWPIYNAARPIPGTVTWEQAGRGVGRFWAAMNPADRYAVPFTQRCAESDAGVLVFATLSAAAAWGRAYCQTHGVDVGDYPPEDFARWSQEGYRNILGHRQEDGE